MISAGPVSSGTANKQQKPSTPQKNSTTSKNTFTSEPATSTPTPSKSSPKRSTHSSKTPTSAQTPSSPTLKPLTLSKKPLSVLSTSSLSPPASGFSPRNSEKSNATAGTTAVLKPEEQVPNMDKSQINSTWSNAAHASMLNSLTPEIQAWLLAMPPTDKLDIIQKTLLSALLLMVGKKLQD